MRRERSNEQATWREKMHDSRPGGNVSPVCFIIAVECLVRRSDKDGRVTMLGVLLSYYSPVLSRLEFADDAALIDESVDMASEQIPSIAKGTIRELITCGHGSPHRQD